MSFYEGNQWRVLDMNPASPAHLVAYDRDGVLATACRWVPRKRGMVISHSQMVTTFRFCCVRCARSVVGQ